MPKAKQSIIFNKPPEHCFKLISQYERYPEFLEEMSHVHIERQESGYMLVQFELDLLIRVTYSLHIFHEEAHRIHWSLDNSNIMKKNDGSWSLEALDDGSTKASYALEIVLKGVIPPSVTSKLAGTTLPKTLQAFKTYIESN